jgi:hypothetical protein
MTTFRENPKQGRRGRLQERNEEAGWGKCWFWSDWWWVFMDFIQFCEIVTIGLVKELWTRKYQAKHKTLADWLIDLSQDTVECSMNLNLLTSSFFNIGLLNNERLKYAG